MIDKIKKYFRRYDNADEMMCGCGCKVYLDVPHGILQRIEKDIIKIVGNKK